jgi:hypothetical protein
MRVKELSPATIDRIKKLRYDRIFEKHESPEEWSWDLEDDSEVLAVEGRQVLLPIPARNLPNITVLRCIIGEHGDTLTLFFKDMTYVRDPKFEAFYSGFLAVCDKLPGEEFFVAIVYHEWFTSAPLRLMQL